MEYENVEEGIICLVEHLASTIDRGELRRYLAHTLSSDDLTKRVRSALDQPRTRLNALGEFESYISEMGSGIREKMEKKSPDISLALYAIIFQTTCEFGDMHRSDWFRANMISLGKACGTDEKLVTACFKAVEAPPNKYTSNDFWNLSDYD